MGSLNVTVLIEQLNILLAEFEALQGLSAYDDLSDRKQESMVLANRLHVR